MSIFRFVTNFEMAWKSSADVVKNNQMLREKYIPILIKNQYKSQQKFATYKTFDFKFKAAQWRNNSYICTMLDLK